MYDIVIVGAGIAGLTAAIYGCRGGKKVLVLEGKTYGGQAIDTLKIANYPALPGVSGPDLAQKIYDQAVGLGAEVKFEKVLEIKLSGKEKVVKTDEGEYKARAIILAVGAEDRKMDLPREEELTGHGIAYCATCDGALYKDKVVAIIGGGNTALYDALYLADIAKKIYVVHRRDEFRADPALVDKVKPLKNVEFVMERKPVEILGDKKVEGLKLDNGQVLDLDGIFVAVGKKPATDKYADLVELDAAGYIVAGEDCKTSADGIFVAGDCRTKNVRQLITAAADGAVAANAAIDYLK